MRLLKSKKALSPVVAAIILIAVTVAVSIAVAAWMGSLTIGFMETSELTITNMAFDTANNNITLTITNSGTSAVTVGTIKVNSNSITSSFPAVPVTYTAGQSGATLEISIASVTAGSKYSVNLFATDGTLVGSYTGTAA